MADRKELEVVPGTLDLMILTTLSVQPMHGWGIGQHIERTSSVFRLRLASLYPALERLQEAGYVKPAWRTSANGRRARYYTITPTGLRHLKAERRDWQARSAGVLRVLEGT